MESKAKQKSVPYAYVRYRVDGQQLKIPQTYIKNFNKDFTPGMDCKAFWSPDGKTPSDITRIQGIILDLDDEVEHGKRGSSSTQSGGYSGYYDAIIIYLADSKEELDLLVDGSNKRVAVPTAKGKEFKKQTAQKGNKKRKACSESLTKKPAISKQGKLKKMIREGNNITAKDWKTKYGETDSSSSTSETSDEELIQKKDLKESMKELQRQNDSFKRANEHSSRQCESLRQENKELRKEIDTLKEWACCMQEIQPCE